MKGYISGILGSSGSYNKSAAAEFVREEFVKMGLDTYDYPLKNGKV